MKTSTIVILGLGAAAVLFFVLRSSGPVVQKGLAPTASMDPKDQALSAGISLAARFLGDLMDDDEAPISLGSGVASPEWIEG